MIINHPQYGEVFVAGDGTMYVNTDEGQVAVGNYNTGQTAISMSNPNRSQGDINLQAMRAAGYLPDISVSGSQYLSGAEGNKFNSPLEYYKYLYGDGVTAETINGETFYKTPNGADAILPGRTPLQFNPPPSTGSQLALGSILALATAGMGGALPGVEGIFGAGAAAAEGAGLAGAGLGELGAGANLGALGADIGGSIASAFTPSAAGAAGVGVGPTLGSAALLGGAGPTVGAAEAAFGGLGSALTPASGGLSSLVADYLPSPLTNGGMGLPTSPDLGQISSNIGAPITDAFVPPSTLGTAANVAGAAGSVANAAGTAGTAANTASTGSALSRIIDGTATTADWASLAGSGLSAGLGVLGANQQADAYKDVADKYLALGAPYRDKLSASYAPGFSMADQPDFMNALNLGADAVARATSTKANTFDPGAQMEMQKYVSGSLALPQLNTYRSQLGTFGNLGTNVAGTTDAASAGQTGSMYNAIGYGLGQITQPQSSTNSALSDLLKRYSTGSTASF